MLMVNVQLPESMEPSFLRLQAQGPIGLRS